MDDDIWTPKRPAAHEIGQKLDDLSVDDLEARAASQRAEIERIEAAITAKRAALEAAGSVFKL